MRCRKFVPAEQVTRFSKWEKLAGRIAIVLRFGSVFFKEIRKFGQKNVN